MDRAEERWHQVKCPECKGRGTTVQVVRRGVPIGAGAPAEEIWGHRTPEEQVEEEKVTTTCLRCGGRKRISLVAEPEKGAA